MLYEVITKEMSSVPMAPTNYAYTRHMLHVAQSGSAAEIAVVALPCAWIYCVVGQHLLKHGTPSKKHPYRDWLMLYASPEFAEVQRWMRMKVDQCVITSYSIQLYEVIRSAIGRSKSGAGPHSTRACAT